MARARHQYDAREPGVEAHDARWQHPGMRRFALALLLLAGCGSHKTPSSPTQQTAGKPAETLPFIDDDFPRALAEAKRTHRPLFVDVWAPWCHTCLSLRAYVLHDPALAELRDRFVWAAIDTENDKNAAFVARYPIEVLPTLFVIDASKEAPVLKWLGSATTPELKALLASVEHGGEAGLARGNRLSAEGKTDEAIAAYRAALAETRPALGGSAIETTKGEDRARVLEALITQLGKRDAAACLSLAKTELPHMPKGTSRANVALFGLGCAQEAKDGAAEKELAAAIEDIVADESDPMLADDRSGLFEALVEDDHARSDADAAKRHAKSWAAFLEAQASKATTNAARAVFDAHRVEAYLELGAPERAVPMLEQSEKDFPGDYNPPARLARVLLAMHRLDDAHAAIDRALSRAYGPRKLRLYLLAADIDHARSDAKAERSTLDAAVAHAQSLTLTPGQKKLVEKIEARRAALP